MPKFDSMLDEFSRPQFRLLYACLYYLDSTLERIKDAAVTQPGIYADILAYTGSWGKHYEVSLFNLITKYRSLNSSADECFIESESTSTPNSVMINHMVEGTSAELAYERGDAESTAISIAAIGNIQGLKLFGCSVSKLVELVSTGDDKALFMAVFVDPASIQAEPIASRICQAQLAGDTAFLEDLSKAIRRKKPRLPKRCYDPIRYILLVVDEIYGLKNVPDKELLGLLVDDLQLGSDDLDDPVDALTKVIRAHKKKSRK